MEVAPRMVRPTNPERTAAQAVERLLRLAGLSLVVPAYRVKEMMVAIRLGTNVRRAAVAQVPLEAMPRSGILAAMAGMAFRAASPVPLSITVVAAAAEVDLLQERADLAAAAMP